MLHQYGALCTYSVTRYDQRGTQSFRTEAVRVCDVLAAIRWVDLNTAEYVKESLHSDNCAMSLQAVRC